MDFLEKPGSFTSEPFRYLHHLSQSRQACRAEFPSKRRRTTRLVLFRRWRRAFRGINLSPFSPLHLTPLPENPFSEQRNGRKFIIICTAVCAARHSGLKTTDSDSRVYGLRGRSRRIFFIATACARGQVVITINCLFLCAGCKKRGDYVGLASSSQDLRLSLSWQSLLWGSSWAEWWMLLQGWWKKGRI